MRAAPCIVASVPAVVRDEKRAGVEAEGVQLAEDPLQLGQSLHEPVEDVDPEVAPAAAAGEVLHDGRLEAAVVEGAAVILVVTRVPSRGDAVYLKSDMRYIADRFR